MTIAVDILARGTTGHNLRRHFLEITPDSAWASGGEAITPNQCGLNSITRLNIMPANGRQPVYNPATGLIELNSVGGIRVQQTRLVKADFTDVTTTGTVDTDPLEAGSIILGWQFVCDNAFSGDTSATAQLGSAEGPDLDRFSAQTTGSIFAAGIVGSAPLAADVMDAQGAAITPRFTVTVATDFTAVSAAASGDLYITYIPGILAGADYSDESFLAEAIGV